MNIFSRPDLFEFLACWIVGTWLLWRYVPKKAANPNKLPLPPGPKGYLVIGNLLEFPTDKPWLDFDEMHKKYGDMVYLKVLGQGFLILGSWERTYDLFEKRSSNYSDRVRSPMLLEIMEWGYNMGPGGADIVGLFMTRKFIQHLLESPEDFDRWISHAAASNIMEVTYGIKPTREDPYVHNAEVALMGLSDAGTPGRYLVETLPIMKYIPAWFPGAGWRRKANYYRDVNRDVCFRPWNLVKEQVKSGTAPPSIAASLVEKLSDMDASTRADEGTVFINTCGVSFIGMLFLLSPTYVGLMYPYRRTISAVRTFVLAMCLFPDVQRKAQAQLDSVLKGRLPDFDNRHSLPYISAVVKETMRWQLVLPLAVYYKSMEDDEYDGYHIPKGTLVAGNAWSILHDPNVYKDPEEFNPDRYLKDGQLNKEVRDPLPAFGFGKRICPGRFFSDNVMFSIISLTLAVFDIKPGLDEAGKEIKFMPEVTGGMLSQPVTFPCRITPRSQAAIKLIRNAEIND